jgi:hypothetical protein
MHTRTSISSISELVVARPSMLPEEPGVYAFWWIADRVELLESNRTVLLKGPNNTRGDVRYDDWWPKELPYPCLYVGKSTNIKKRFAQHIKSKSTGRLHTPHQKHYKATPYTTSCQLRWGIEHIFPNEPNPLGIILHAVGFSYRTDFPDNPIAERFFEEDRLVGNWRPWFNIDSER